MLAESRIPGRPPVVAQPLHLHERGHEGDELGWRFPPDYVVTPELSAALISALDREARMHLDGCTVTGFEGNRRPKVRSSPFGIVRQKTLSQPSRRLPMMLHSP